MHRIHPATVYGARIRADAQWDRARLGYLAVIDSAYLPRFRCKAPRVVRTLCAVGCRPLLSSTGQSLPASIRQQQSGAGRPTANTHQRLPKLPPPPVPPVNGTYDVNLRWAQRTPRRRPSIGSKRSGCRDAGRRPFGRLDATQKFGSHLADRTCTEGVQYNTPTDSPSGQKGAKHCCQGGAPARAGGEETPGGCGGR